MRKRTRFFARYIWNIFLPAIVLGCQSAPTRPVYHIQPGEIRLCTGGTDGNYFRAGNIIQRHGTHNGVDVRVMTTAGSLDNIERLYGGQCDAAIVQADAFIAWENGKDTADKPVDVTINDTLYREVAHLVCKRDSGIHSIADIRDHPLAYRLIVSDRKSGHRITLTEWGSENSDYEKIPLLYRRGSMAVYMILDGDDAQCIFYISGLMSPYILGMDKYGRDLRMIPIADPDITEIQYRGEKVYTPVRIPSGVYPLLTNGPLETIAVRAVLVIRNQWLRRADPRIRDRFLRAIHESKSDIHTAVNELLLQTMRGK